MKRRNCRPGLAGLAALLVALAACGASSDVWAQRGARTPAPSAKEAAKKPRAKARGRLPSYFSRVVGEKQREEIYRMQAAYAEKIAQIRKQLDQMLQQRDRDIEGVLTAEQLAEVKKLRAAARAKRAKSKPKREPDPVKSPTRASRQSG